MRLGLSFMPLHDAEFSNVDSYIDQACTSVGQERIRTGD